MPTGFWWGKPEGKRLFGRPRHRWDNNVKEQVGRACFWLIWLIIRQTATIINALSLASAAK